jgi:hypothetical protein
VLVLNGPDRYRNMLMATVRVGQHDGKHPGEASEDLTVSLVVVRVLRDQFLRLVQTVPVPMKVQLAHSSDIFLRYLLPGLVHLESESGN